MRILLVSDYAAPDGGAEIATRQLRDGLRERGHEVQWLASSARRNEAGSDADVECFGTTGPMRTMLQSANPLARAALHRTLERFDPHVVHVGIFLTQLSPLILPLLRDRPSVYYAHWLRAICPTGSKLLPDGTRCTQRAGSACLSSRCLPLHDWLPLMAQHRLLESWRRSFTRTVANSEATRDALLADGFPVTDVIRCGVRGVDVRATFEGVPTALFSGRLARQKGVHVLLEAWATVTRAVPDALLLIAGDGPELTALQRIATPSVRFLGRLTPQALHDLAREAWVQVVPSIGFESFGLVAVEAMLRGQPVIASRIGGLPESVEQD
ncbi:MAG TPA: glycosyltransferase family 4 protein, partial [Gemmatimonadaceae bacterium]|nr:glycosyltransferase family 4 protein [Gemmatimonadaceae bacterium]